MLHNLGIDGIITATTLENRFRTLILHIQDLEKDLENKNRYNADIIIDATEDAESGTMEGNCQLYVLKNIFNLETFPDPYIGESWVKGSGASIATNYNMALAETVWLLYMAEGSSDNNPNEIERKITTPELKMLSDKTFSPCPHNGLLTFSFEIPIITVVHGDRSVTTAREWLINS